MRWWRFFSLIVLALFGLFSYLAITHAAFKPLEAVSPVRHEFQILSEDRRILYKPSVKSQAFKIAAYLDKAIAQIEKVHGKPFPKKVIVHLCDTPACFKRYTRKSEKIAAAVTEKGLFLSPLIFKNDQGLPFLAHELSHMHLFYQVPLLSTRLMPQWFHDGLATFASDGGGAHRVTDKQAIDFIKQNKHIQIKESGPLWGERWPLTYWPSTDYRFQQNMNYRQSSLFLAFLARGNKHHELLRAIEARERFGDAFLKVYSASPQEMWARFERSLETH